jgi:hypothetical protein
MTRQQPHLRKLGNGLYAVVNWRRQKTKFQVGDFVVLNFTQGIISSISDENERYEMYDRGGMLHENVPSKALRLIKEFDGKAGQIQFSWGSKKK